MELSSVDREAPASVLRAAWWAWWAVVVSWVIGLIRLTSYVLSNYFNGDGDDDPIGVWASVFDGGRVAVGASTAVALIFVIVLAARTRTSTVLALGIIALSVLFTLFVYFADYMAWMVSAKGLFAFTPRMLSLDYIYLVLTLVILLGSHFVSGYLAAGVFGLALVITAFFLAAAAQRWRAIEKVVEA